MKTRVAVIFGGKSTEHEISIISAVQAMNNMDADKYEIIPLYLSCLLYTSPSPRDGLLYRMPSSA